MTAKSHTIQENSRGGWDVIAPEGEVVITYPYTAQGGSEHAEMLAGVDADTRDGLYDGDDD